MRHSFNICIPPCTWLLQVKTLAFLQVGCVDLVLSSSFNLETEAEITMEHDVGIEDIVTSNRPG